MVVKKQSAIIFLDRAGFYFYTLSLSDVAFFPFTETAMKDLEVVSVAELENQIKSFADQIKMPPCDITIILSSNVIFEKDMQEILPDHKETEVQKILDSIPFDSIIKLLLPVENGIRVIAANYSLYKAFNSSFDKIGSSISQVIPYEALGVYSSIQSLDLQVAPEILRKIESFKQYNMISDYKSRDNKQLTSHQDQTGNKQTNKARLYGMVGFFSLLLLILVFMLLKY